MQGRRLGAVRRRRWQRARTAYEVAWWDDAASRTEVRRSTDVPGYLARLAAELADLCEPSEPGWAERLRRVSRQAAAAPTPESLSVTASSVLGMYGGTGSLNDLVLQDSSGPLPGNDRVEELRSLLHAAAVAAR